MDETFTVDQLARFMRVAPRIVRRWLDSHRLEGFRDPVTLEWKVAKHVMLTYMRENAIVIPECFSTPADSIQSRPGVNVQRR